MRQVKVLVEGQDRGFIELTATSVEHHISVVFEEGGGQKSTLQFGTLYMGERREYPAFIVNNGPGPADFNFTFKQGMQNLDEKYEDQDENYISPHEHGKELTDRVLTAEPLSGSISPYSQFPVKFICRTKKYEKESGFSDHAKKPESRQGSAGAPSAKDYNVDPIEEAAVAVINFGVDHDPIMVQMMYRACYPDIKINRQIFQFGECNTHERKDFNLTIKNKNEDLPLDFNFSKVAHFHAVPA
mmetsp:Transcript_43632/g.42147  ORF Transcript_43632/g.42147 Transcript_43632/m.42147 type:complete len:243 (+) Transcript_43632:639-1367(+)